MKGPSQYRGVALFTFAMVMAVQVPIGLIDFGLQEGWQK